MNQREDINEFLRRKTRKFFPSFLYNQLITDLRIKTKQILYHSIRLGKLNRLIRLKNNFN